MCPELPQTGWPEVVQGSKVSVPASKVKYCLYCVLLALSLRAAQIQGKGAQIPPLNGESIKAYRQGSKPLQCLILVYKE